MGKDGQMLNIFFLGGAAVCYLVVGLFVLYTRKRGPSGMRSFFGIHILILASALVNLVIMSWIDHWLWAVTIFIAVPIGPILLYVTVDDNAKYAWQRDNMKKEKEM